MCQYNVPLDGSMTVQLLLYYFQVQLQASACDGVQIMTEYNFEYTGKYTFNHLGPLRTYQQNLKSRGLLAACVHNFIHNRLRGEKV